MDGGDTLKLELGRTERADLVQGLDNELGFIYVEVP